MADLKELVARTLAGEADAWPVLQAAVEPSIAAVARRHRGLRRKGLAALPDDLAEITTLTLERLARTEFQNLRRFLEQLARKQDDTPFGEAFDDWLYGVVDFVIREHLRKRFGRAPKLGDAPDEVRLSKRDLHTQAGRLDDGEVERSFLRTVGMTARLTAAEIFAHIERDFAPDEARALRLYYAEDQAFDEIAAALGLPDGKAADRLVRKLNARLRYRFVDAQSTSSEP